MEYRRMGRTGLRVSTICLGTMTFGFQTEEQAALRIMDAAWDAGVNFLDTADAYPMGSEETGATEEIVGTWLAQMPRDRVVLATKAWGATGTGPNRRPGRFRRTPCMRQTGPRHGRWASGTWYA